MSTRDDDPYREVGMDQPALRTPAPAPATKTGIALTWGPNKRDGHEHVEWHARCGCAFHPRPAPHWHPCAEHRPGPRAWCLCQGAGTCIGCMIEQAVRRDYGTQGLGFLRRHVRAGE